MSRRSRTVRLSFAMFFAATALARAAFAQDVCPEPPIASCTDPRTLLRQSADASGYTIQVVWELVQAGTDGTVMVQQDCNLLDDGVPILTVKFANPIGSVDPTFGGRSLTLAGAGSSTGPSEPSLIENIAISYGRFWNMVGKKIDRCLTDWGLVGPAKKEPVRFYRIPNGGGGIRGSVGFPGISLFENSPAFIGDPITIPAGLATDAEFLFAFENVGDGDWLEVTLDDSVIWSGRGTSFEQGVVYEAVIPKGLVAGRTGLLIFALHSTGASNAEVTIGSGDDALITFDSFAFTGFFQPVDNSPVVNKTKAGSAVPIKFSLGGYQGLDIVAAGYPASQPALCDSSPTDALEQTATPGSSSLSYDETTDTYTYVWKTDKAWAGCRTFTLGLRDGGLHTAVFNFTR